MSDEARAGESYSLAGGDVYEATRLFVQKYALPLAGKGGKLPLEHIYQGWQNRNALPRGSNEYAVVSILFSMQHGTSIQRTITGEGDQPDRQRVFGLVEHQVQIDICSNTDIAQQRANSLYVFCRSDIAVQHFNDAGLSLLYADQVRDLSFVGDSNQFVRRYTMTLRITSVCGVEVDFETFDEARASRIENVDVHHPPGA